MQHLKNIKSGNPKTKEQYQLTKNFDVIWLWSEDGKNWYEEVKNFQPDTIKIVYEANNIIVAITKDASTLNPEGYSVVEVPDITANRCADDSGTGCAKAHGLMQIIRLLQIQVAEIFVLQVLWWKLLALAAQ